MSHARAQLEQVSGLLAVLADVPDPRRRRGVRHQLVGVLALALGAVLAGARSYAAIAQWAGDLNGEQVIALGLTAGRAPDASTFRRVFGRLDASVFRRRDRGVHVDPHPHRPRSPGDRDRR
jgi:hypothetical protein